MYPIQSHISRETDKYFVTNKKRKYYHSKGSSLYFGDLLKTELNPSLSYDTLS